MERKIIKLIIIQLLLKTNFAQHTLSLCSFHYVTFLWNAESLVHERYIFYNSSNINCIMSEQFCFIIDKRSLITCTRFFLHVRVFLLHSFKMYSVRDWYQIAGHESAWITAPQHELVCTTARCKAPEWENSAVPTRLKGKGN